MHGTNGRMNQYVDAQNNDFFVTVIIICVVLPTKHQQAKRGKTKNKRHKI
jgi:hypothetical protein